MGASGGGGGPTGTRRTLIEFNGANCAWCLNNTLSHLRSHPSVLLARVREGTGCIEVDHDAGDLDELLAGLHVDLRGWQKADNGERMMVELKVHEAAQCRFRPPERGGLS